LFYFAVAVSLVEELWFCLDEETSTSALKGATSGVLEEEREGEKEEEFYKLEALQQSKDDAPPFVSLFIILKIEAGTSKKTNPVQKLLNLCFLAQHCS
jgi:hypothetical protein